jgi:Uma2 family endonuclease
MSSMTGHQHRDDAGGSKRKLTYADFRKFPDDGQRHELIDGEHYVTASPNTRHQVLSVRLTVALANFLDEHSVGQVFHVLDCVFGKFDVVEPDLLVVLNDQLDILTKKNIKGVPALVVEILSPSSLKVDSRIKRTLFERRGVKEYWVIDPVADRVAVHRLGPGGAFRFPVMLEASRADSLTTPLLPRFSLKLAHYFR